MLIIIDQRGTRIIARQNAGEKEVDQITLDHKGGPGAMWTKKKLRLQTRTSPEADEAYRKVHRKVWKNIKAVREARCLEIDNGMKWDDFT